MRINKFVLDANIWVSYFIKKNELKIIDIITENKLSIYYCDELITEVKRVLAYPHLVKYNVNIKQSIEIIKIIGKPYILNYPIKNYIKDDSDDSYLIALALQTNSGFITSGDSHILSQKEKLEKQFTKLKIITKTEFEKMF